MRYYVIMTAYNEADFIEKTLLSMVKQSFLPKKLVVVDDHSTDITASIVEKFAKQFPWIELVRHLSTQEHLPGAKVIQAFQKGLSTLDADYDFIVKIDADLIFPTHYFETIRNVFESNSKIGMAGGFAYIQKEDTWVLEQLTDQDHIRGAFKAYRKSCFEAIGGLKTSMGWDTVDEWLARYYGFDVVTIPSLQVKHLKPTGARYDKKSRLLQGESFYKLGYGSILSGIASMKLAIRKNKISLFIDYMEGYWKAKINKETMLVSPEQAKFVRNFRWNKIKQKIHNA